MRRAILIPRIIFVLSPAKPYWYDSKTILTNRNWPEANRNLSEGREP